MICKTNEQLHDALMALIDGSTGTTREALVAIIEYTDAELSMEPINLEKLHAESVARLKRSYYVDQCCRSCQNYDMCGVLDERIKELKAIEASGGNVALAKMQTRGGKNDVRK